MIFHHRLTMLIALVLAGLLLAFAFGALRVNTIDPIGRSTPGARAAAVPTFKHIFVIVLENKEYEQVIGSPRTPYINALAQQHGLATSYYGIQHPSLPNYLALIGGDTFGVDSNCTDCFIDAPNLVDQLEGAGKSWKGYMEGMPGPCFVGDQAPLYRQKHNPFIYFDSIRLNPARCQKIVPFTEFATDLQNNQVPAFAWITPDMCNAAHDCSLDASDAWLQAWVPRILASPAWQDNGALFITFDEGSTNAGCCQEAAGGRIMTLVLSPLLVQPGFRSDVPYTHYSLLRTIEMSWGLPLLAKANCDCSLPMSDFFKADASS